MQVHAIEVMDGGDSPGVMGGSGWLRGLLRGWAATWDMRRRLRRCAELDTRFARDIGLSEAEIFTECEAPLWAAYPRVAAFRPGLDATWRHFEDRSGFGKVVVRIIGDRSLGEDQHG